MIRGRFTLAAAALALSCGAGCDAFAGTAFVPSFQRGGFGGVTVGNGVTSVTSRYPQSSSISMVASADAPTAVDTEKATRDALLDDYVKARGGSRPIRKILIANNGMAATKSILSMRQWAYMELGDEKCVQFVAMATAEDIRANAEFIRLADSFVEVPAGKNSNNYANVDVITRIATENNVDAVWPGWGHASENPNLPNTLNKLGIKFIGPTGPVMSVLGDKIAANILAQTAKVPSIPWSGSWGGPDDGPLEAKLTDEGTIPDETFERATCRNVEEAVAAAKRIGYENGIMIKASEGGGGKGIRFVEKEEDLADAYIQVSNEVIGSPIFLMQLCKNARHLEVQIVGDEHGNAVALNGRDCSTQRRFQKIFEEGPPIIAPKDTFKEMERAAQRLTQEIGYVGAGTVEYLFNADTGKFFFLELNPRLQVEHPVTEGITGLNLPATQLQVAMGIPLNMIPEVRSFYDKDPYGNSEIKFLEEDYKNIANHVIAARITAENPDEGFKPTSGSIERIKFQSTVNVWGYFSVGANGGIHEFADSQFGHLFARGPTRESARKSLVQALKQIEVRGEIRTTVEYLVQLLETDDFKQNTIDTAWLDGLLKDKSVYVAKPPHLVVMSAAIFRAFQQINSNTAGIIESFKKGQVGTGSIKSLNSLDIEIAYLDTKYNFDVVRVSPEIFRMTINGVGYDVEVIESASGGLIAKFGGETHRIFGMEEPLGLRLVLDSVTILMPTIFDPSELRTDVTGKVVRYLQENGAEVLNGQPYVEVEAMKMIMPVKASESGTITHALSPGSVISQGDLLASLTLKDPSKVKKIVTFTDKLDIVDAVLEVEAKKSVDSILAGYVGDADGGAAALLGPVTDGESGAALIAEVLEEYFRIESQFDGKLKDDVVRDLIKANKDSLQTVIDVNMAHETLALRNKLVLAMLRQLEAFPDRFGVIEMPSSLLSTLKQLTKLEGKAYGAVALAAGSIIRQSKVPSFSSRLEDLKALITGDSNRDALSKSMRITSGVDLLSALFYDADSSVRTAAVELYIRRIYRAHTILDISVAENDGRLTCSWSSKVSDNLEGVVCNGLMSVIPDGRTLDGELPSIIAEMKSSFGEATIDEKINTLHIATNVKEITDVEETLRANKGAFDDLKIRSANVLVPVPQRDPTYYTFPECKNYSEDPLRRNMRPTWFNILEINRLVENYSLDRLNSLGKNVQIYLGVEKSTRPVRNPSQVVFVRALSHSDDLATGLGASRSLSYGLDELENAFSDPRVSMTSSSRIFLHSLSEIDMAPEEMGKNFEGVMELLKTRLAPRLLKLRVDEIEVKMRVKTVIDGKDAVQGIRLIASSMRGEWLKLQGFLEVADPVSGEGRQFCTMGENIVCTVDPYGISNSVQIKRAIARRVGSSYAYDFLGLLEVGIINEWASHIKDLSAAEVSGPNMPTIVFSSQELLLGDDGELSLGFREIGTNKVGMLAWEVTMKTPEYPEGREVVFIANDVTVQSGSFGVEEDEFFYKASEYARKKKIPRVYISCNAGARIGLVDELKSKFNIKFTDPENPSKGLDYLYLTKEDYDELPDGTVNAHEVKEGWAIDDIIGTKHGIGVENLQGSGKIAGETSRAYDEIFTLSYATGRSVGIGAYLVRLGQRVIQMKTGPLILTGFSALNKLLGRDVYTSQDQLGGPQIMFPNGVSHEIVEDDQAGVASILKWLSFVPKDMNSQPSTRQASDPISRQVEFRPTKTPYDPRFMLGGGDDKLGFFDKDSWKEYLAGWGKSVVIGRARLGGIPMGVVAVETRLVEQVVPADPADVNSREAILPQAGQVLFPDSSYKTAQALRDFNNEGLPVMLFANWRGFSGGSRDMAGEILKFGAQIVDALREYEHPVFVYLPPHGELRGGSWVVVDPTINPEKMSMYADPDSRGGILEPAGITEVKFRITDQIASMHRIDSELRTLDYELSVSQTESDTIDIKANIAAREEILKPVYLQAATEFADLHDKTGRMLAKGVIKAAVPWEKSREFFFHLAKRRIMQDEVIATMLAADSNLDNADALSKLESLCTCNWEDDQAVVGFLENSADAVALSISNLRASSIRSKIEALNAELEKLQ